MAAKRLQALSQQIAEGVPDAGTFEGIPKIRQVAGDSLGPYVRTNTWLERAATRAQLTWMITDG